MKKINKSILGLSAAALLSMTSLTGCIEETFPTSSTATDEQVAASASATEAMALGMPAALVDVWSTSSHCYFGYPAEMIFRDMLTGDYYHQGETGYSHFISWQRNQYMGGNWMKTQFHWNYYYGQLLSINGLIGAVNEETATSEQKAYLAAGLAYRALSYLDLARMYEFLPNDKFADGKNTEGTTVTNLTVPIVTNETTAEEAANNPRATREEMKAFIEKDLDRAQAILEANNIDLGQTIPDLGCVYGLKARLYMWVEDYAQAEKYARLAINASRVQPISQATALNTTIGYNRADQFMWAATQNKETGSVQNGIINWTSWVSNQTTFGYTGAATALYVVMDKNMYERISDTDWRKLQWIAPAGSPLAGQNALLSAADAKIPAYGTIKFRPNEGNAEDYNTGASSAVPVMRVEEMYFIEAEAAAHQDAARGKELLVQFMKTRDANYTCGVNSQDAVVEEIVFQKRVELWGEGQTFFDIKRLNMSVTRGYTGTNCQDEKCRLNTEGRPAWMNIVIVETEQNNNEALVNHNNPDPSDVYSPWAE